MQILHSGKTDAVLLEHIGLMNQSSTVLHPAAQHVLLAALRRRRLPQLQELHPGANERHSSPPPRRLVRRRDHAHGMTTTVFGQMDVACHHGPLRQNQARKTRQRRLRAPSDDDFSDAVTEAAAPHARDECFAKHITPEAADEGPPVWATAEESEVDTELIDAASFDVQLGALHRTASGIRRWTALALPRECHLHHISASFPVVSRVNCLVCCAHACESLAD